MVKRMELKPSNYIKVRIFKIEPSIKMRSVQIKLLKLKQLSKALLRNAFLRLSLETKRMKRKGKSSLRKL